jgi:hypothetical protein
MNLAACCSRVPGQDAVRIWLAIAWLTSGLVTTPGHAEETTNTGTGTRTTSARLDFTINIDRMVFLRVGNGGAHAGGASGAGPAASGSVNSLSFGLGPMSIPGVPTSPVNGNNQTVNWNGGVPGYATPAAASLPVEVRSNAGQVRITAQVSAPLTNGSFIIPMSEIAITSSNVAQLPAPTVPDTGTGPAVNVALGGPGTAAAPTLLTYRTANWSFSYVPVTSPVAGNYSGQITFSASAP